MLDNAIDVVEIKSSGELLKTVEGLKNDGYRYATMICLKNKDGHDLIYIFDKDNKLKNLRYFVKPGEKPKSVSGIYLTCTFDRERVPGSLRIDFRWFSNRLQRPPLLNAKQSKSSLGLKQFERRIT